jgi:hypothetical protein
MTFRSMHSFNPTFPSSTKSANSRMPDSSSLSLVKRKNDDKSNFAFSFSFRLDLRRQEQRGNVVQPGKQPFLFSLELDFLPEEGVREVEDESEAEDEEEEEDEEESEREARSNGQGRGCREDVVSAVEDDAMVADVSEAAAVCVCDAVEEEEEGEGDAAVVELCCLFEDAATARLLWCEVGDEVGLLISIAVSSSLLVLPPPPLRAPVAAIADT